MSVSGKTFFAMLREQAGLTLEEAAVLLEVSERTAYRYESGTTVLPRLAQHTLPYQNPKPYPIRIKSLSVQKIAST
jgi:DNA-binding transcriptional regulator YiaG